MASAEEYPEQFYVMPKFHGRKDAEIYKLKILTAIANEMHGVRRAIEKVHNLKPETTEQS